MEVCITNYGGRIVSLCVPDKNGKPTDVVLGFDNIAQYADTINTPSDYGSSVGRYANRIKDGKFTLNEKEYQLKKNDGPNCLHGGGNTGWMHQVYEAEQIGDSILKLTIVGKDGENGFPGKIMAVTTYKITADNVLDMTWEAETEKPTIINQTNHNYYNLSGDFSQPGYDMVLYVNADNFTPSDKLYIPTGEIKSVSPKTGIFMEMFTNEPGVQVYSGNFQGVGPDAKIARKHGLTYPQHVSVCLESQKYPDSPNHPDWIQPTLNPGEKYYSHAAYKFSIK